MKGSKSKPKVSKSKPKISKEQKQITKDSKSKVTKDSDQKTSNSQVTKIINNIKSKPGKIILGTLGTLAAGYGLYKIKNYYTKTVSISAKINTEEDAIKVLFNPKEVGIWKGDPMIASIFLNEYLYKLPDVCDNKKYNTHLLIFGHDGSMAIKNKDSIRAVNIQEMADHLKQITEYSECSSKRFFIIPIVIIIHTGGGHANTLIYDSKNKSIDHFEPYGSHENVEQFLHTSYVQNNISSICKILNIKYNDPNQTCPRFGPQFLESIKCPIVRIIKNNFKTDIGFCLTWSLFYTELRIKNPDIDSKELIKKATDNLGWSMCNFISAYSSNILNFSKKFDLIVDKHGLVIDYKEKSII